MKLTINIFLAFLIIFNSLVFAAPKRDEATKKFEPTEKSWKAADKMLKKMTVEEKVGQVVQGDIASITPADMKKYHLGSVLNGGGSAPGNDEFASPD